MAITFASLSIHKFVSSVGADAGFAAIIGLAILILLYFAHAREAATLRDRLDEAHTRIAALEGRLQQVMQQGSLRRGPVQQPLAPPAPAPAPVPAPAPSRAMGTAAASVRRVPAATTAAALGNGQAQVGASGLLPAAPVGLGAPALASATKLIPDPALPAAAAPGTGEDTMFIAPAAGANGHGQVAAAGLGDETQALAPVAPGVARRRGAAVPPPMQIRPDAGAATQSAPRRGAPRAATAASSNINTPPTIHGGRFSGRLVPLAIVAVAVVVIIVGLVVITSNGGSGTTGGVHSPANASDSTGSSQTGAQEANKKAKVAIFKPSSATVAVLNGTAVNGLAGVVGAKLAGEGYKKGNITNAASQTQTSTVVFYLPGSVNKVAAEHVATALSLKPSSVKPANQTAIQSCSTSVTGAQTTSCDAGVIVSVGANLASLASSGSAG